MTARSADLMSLMDGISNGIQTIQAANQGITRIQAAGADVVLIDPQYSPRVNEHAESAGKMMTLLNKVAELRKVGLFPRFELMRRSIDAGLSLRALVAWDGLHNSAAGYDCIGRALARAIHTAGR